MLESNTPSRCAFSVPPDMGMLILLPQKARASSRSISQSRTTSSSPPTAILRIPLPRGCQSCPPVPTVDSLSSRPMLRSRPRLWRRRRSLSRTKASITSTSSSPTPACHTSGPRYRSSRSKTSRDTWYRTCTALSGCSRPLCHCCLSPPIRDGLPLALLQAVSRYVSFVYCVAMRTAAWLTRTYRVIEPIANQQRSLCNLKGGRALADQEDGFRGGEANSVRHQSRLVPDKSGQRRRALLRYGAGSCYSRGFLQPDGTVNREGYQEDAWWQTAWS